MSSIKNHPLHPMLVGFPIGSWTFALICDVVHVASGNGIWQTVATYSVAGGIVGAIVAAVPGLIDYFSIDEAGMKRVANLHLAVNLGAVAIFAINLWLRLCLPTDSNLPLILSVIGVLDIGLGGWLGGEMVYVKGLLRPLPVEIQCLSFSMARACKSRLASVGSLRVRQAVPHLRAAVQELT